VAYNAGGSFVPIARHINSGETGKAMQIIASRTHSGPKIMPGLVNRRKAEIALYTHGRYC
jgi:GH24 family phage-related lysozyme (muramidase)